LMISQQVEKNWPMNPSGPEAFSLGVIIMTDFTSSLEKGRSRWSSHYYTTEKVIYSGS
jgi:hypothetical protein